MNEVKRSKRFAHPTHPFRTLAIFNSLSLFCLLLLYALSILQRLTYWGDSVFWEIASIFFFPLACVLLIPVLVYLLLVIPANAILFFRNKDQIKPQSLFLSWIPILISIVLLPLVSKVQPIVDQICVKVEFGRCQPFLDRIEDEFELSRVIPKYDLVVDALEEYHQEMGRHPSELSELVPKFIAEVPSVEIPSGNLLLYRPEPMWKDSPTFTLLIRGNYPGIIRSLHGWALYYCPIEYAGCTPGGDRHTQSYRIDKNWLWVHSSF